MTLSQLEQRLQAINPQLHIKRYGTSMAAVHKGSQHLFRIPQGEITLYDVTAERLGHADQYVSDENPTGRYMYTALVRRGIGNLAHLLYMGKVITSREAALLRNGGTK